MAQYAWFTFELDEWYNMSLADWDLLLINADNTHAEVAVIKNISTQSIKILYSKSPRAYNITDIPYDKEGEAIIARGEQLVIEVDRINLGQLINMRENDIITYTTMTLYLTDSI